MRPRNIGLTCLRWEDWGEVLGEVVCSLWHTSRDWMHQLSISLMCGDQEGSYKGRGG